MATITSFTPKTGVSGSKITITGTGFTGATAVSFGGTPALAYTVVSATQIDAFVDAGTSGLIVVLAPSGNATIAGFTFSAVKVKLPGLPPLGRQADALNGDMVYMWDGLRQILTKADVSLLPQPGQGSANVYTALGSPFKVRGVAAVYDASTGITTINDIRLIGKNDYVVSCTDLNVEFENYFEPATALGTTTANDNTYTNQSPVNISGTGTGAKYDILTVSHKVRRITQTNLGSGYAIGDTFSIASLPNIVFTVSSLTGNTGNLEYDAVNGNLFIHNYQLPTGRHITIYADGVVSTDLQNYLISLKNKIATYDLIIGPVLVLHGTVWPWRKSALLIPAGWQEATDLRGKMLIGQDLTDVYDVHTNPNGLSQDVNSEVGDRLIKIPKGALPAEPLTIPASVNNIPGTPGQPVAPNYPYVANTTVPTSNLGNGDDLDITNPARIVNWIEYVGP